MEPHEKKPKWLFGLDDSESEKYSPDMEAYEADRDADLQSKLETRKFTAPQLRRIQEQPGYTNEVDEIKKKLESGAIAPGNVELAAILGWKPAQIALGRQPSEGMEWAEFIQFLMSDPNLKIRIDVG